MAGIGNAVMTVPMVRRLGAGHQVVVEASSAVIGEVFDRLDEVANVVVLPASLRERLRVHRGLRGDWYVVPFPSNRWEYTALAATSRCANVLIHDYPTGAMRTGRRLLGATRVPAQRGIHDVEQNLALVDGLQPAGSQRPELDPVFPIRDSERKQATALQTPAVVQVGCADTVVGRAKRLPDATWAAVVDQLADRGVACTLIEGPDEQGDGRRVADLCRSSPPVLPLTGTLGTSAAVLAQAELFVGVDSGLAHVAAAVGVPKVVTVFTAADPERVAPWGHRDRVVTPRDTDGRSWSPRLLYPMDHPKPKLRNDRIDWSRHVDAGDIVSRSLA